VNDGTTTLTSGAVSLTIHPLPPTPTITFTGGSLISSSSTGNQWYLNDAMIPNATDPVYTPVVSGLYYVIVSDLVSGCPSEPSNTINFLMTGIDPLTFTGLVSVYPNPIREIMTISYELPEPGFVKIALYDAFGKEVRMIQDNPSQTAGKHRIEMAAGNLNNGIYLVKVQTQTYTVTRKVLLAH
jgi:trimeric autotransporter adhesin